MFGDLSGLPIRIIVLIVVASAAIALFKHASILVKGAAFIFVVVLAIGVLPGPADRWQWEPVLKQANFKTDRYVDCNYIISRDVRCNEAEEGTQLLAGGASGTQTDVLEEPRVRNGHWIAQTVTIREGRSLATLRGADPERCKGGTPGEAQDGMVYECVRKKAMP